MAAGCSRARPHPRAAPDERHGNRIDGPRRLPGGDPASRNLMFAKRWTPAPGSSTERQMGDYRAGRSGHSSGQLPPSL